MRFVLVSVSGMHLHFESHRLQEVEIPLRWICPTQERINHALEAHVFSIHGDLIILSHNAGKVQACRSWV